MNHFDESTEISKPPSEEDLLANDLRDMFGFDYDENDRPTIQSNLDDNPEVKRSALQNVTQLLELRKSELATEARLGLAEAIHLATQPGASPEQLSTLISLLQPESRPQPIAAAPILKGDLTERQWLIQNWLPANCVSMFTGTGGVGKSFATLQIACGLISGVVMDCFFKKTEAPAQNAKLPTINVVYAAWEDELQEVSRRVRRIKGNLEWPNLEKIANQFYYVDLKKFGPIWGPKAGDHLSTRGGLLQCGEELLRICEDKRAQLLVLDPSAGAFGGNENDRAAVREFTGYMSGWGVDNKCAALIISHPPKTGETYSGSTDWLGSVRSLWNLGLRSTTIDKKEEKYYSLRHEKSNYSLTQSEMYLVRGKYGVWTEVVSSEDAVIVESENAD